MTKFAAYDDYSIYAVGETADEAIATARHDARDPTATFKTAPISNAFAAWINAHGWDGASEAFAMDDNGFLYRIVDEMDENAAFDVMQRKARIETGDGDDRDTGWIVEIIDGMAEVSWDSGVRTPCPISDLRVAS